jgi:hypothetical protein
VGRVLYALVLALGGVLRLAMGPFGQFVEVFLIGMCLHSAKLVGDAEGPLLVRQKRLDAHFSFLGR